MPDLPTLAAFALVSLGLVLSPGPNMLYLVSQSITQGRIAGLISLAGVACGFMVWLLAACAGIAALLAATPAASLSTGHDRFLAAVGRPAPALPPPPEGPPDMDDLGPGGADMIGPCGSLSRSTGRTTHTTSSPGSCSCTSSATPSV